MSQLSTFLLIISKSANQTLCVWGQQGKCACTHTCMYVWGANFTLITVRRINPKYSPGSVQFSSVQSLSHVQPVQFSSVAQSCPTLCNPMDYSMPGIPVHHQLLELAQIHVYQVSDAIQPSHPLLSPYPPAFNLSQHEGLSNESVLHIRWQSIGVSPTASVLPMNIQD